MTTINCFLFSIFRKQKTKCFQIISFSYFQLCFLELFLKIIIQTYIMIKNKAMEIKIIFIIYLKILKIS